jgi:hypothetical protein
VRDVSAILADEKVNITALSAVVHKDQTATVWLTVEVPRLDRLSRIMSRLEGIRDVFNVVREVGSAHALRAGRSASGCQSPMRRISATRASYEWPCPITWNSKRR